jgi:peroxiredoxin
MMDKKILLSILVLCLFSIYEAGMEMAYAKKIQLIKVGDLFPETRLEVPKDPNGRKYLNLKEIENFALKEIKADLVIVEILSVYCPSCQRQTPVFNKLFGLIENDAKTRGRIKMMGIAVGNSNREVQDFVKRYKIPFPIIPDPNFEMHRAIGGSRTPFTILVRPDPSNMTGIVADTHLGSYKQHKRLFKKVKKLMAMDLAAIQKKGRKEKGKSIVVKPILSETKLTQKVKAALAASPGRVTQFQQVPLKNNRSVYTGLVQKNGADQRLIAEVISRPPTCDVCHDIHFIYVFDTKGKVLKFVPLHLTKYGNKAWSAKDVTKMRGQVVGKYITEPLAFNPEVDAVSKATITSSIIYDSISQGESLLKALKEKGYN